MYNLYTCICIIYIHVNAHACLVSVRSVRRSRHTFRFLSLKNEVARPRLPTRPVRPILSCDIQNEISTGIIPSHRMETSGELSRRHVQDDITVYVYIVLHGYCNYCTWTLYINLHTFEIHLMQACCPVNVYTCIYIDLDMQRVNDSICKPEHTYIKYSCT